MESLKVPEYILQKSKEFAWPDCESKLYLHSTHFADYVLDNGLFKHKESNFRFRDIESLLGVDMTNRLSDCLSPYYESGMIEGYLTILDLYKAKPVKMKAGKYMRKLLPFLTDSQVESVVAELKAKFQPKEYELIIGDTELDFHNVYMTPHTPKRSPYFKANGYRLNRLDSSCMRAEYFDNWEKHPASVYGHGDLAIAYAIEKTERTIGARVVLYPAKLSCQAIYTCDDTAQALIDSYLSANGYKERGIDGARVSKIPCKAEGGFLMPYIDNGEYCEDLGDSFLLGSGRIRCTSTCGYIETVESFYCDDCGDDCESTTEINGACVCQYCRSENYTYSELMDEYIPNDNADSNGYGEVATSDWFSSNGYVLDHEGIWQVESDCVEFEGEYYHESSYYVTSFDGKYYHVDSDELKQAQEEKEKLDAAYQVKVTHAFGWHTKQVSNGYRMESTPVMGQYQTKERTLRDNYQLDANGNPERLPEFDFA
jgi:hypothetical protein